MRLPTEKQIKRILLIAKDTLGDIGAIDISVNGISVARKGESGSAFDAWKKNKDSDRHTHN